MAWGSRNQAAEEEPCADQSEGFEPGAAEPPQRPDGARVHHEAVLPVLEAAHLETAPVQRELEEPAETGAELVKAGMSIPERTACILAQLLSNFAPPVHKYIS